MAARFNKEKFRAFCLRRKINAFGLLTITVISAIVTLICAMTGISARKLDLLVWVTIALIALCFIQAFKMKKSFRTLSAKGLHRKKKKTPTQA